MTDQVTPATPAAAPAATPSPDVEPQSPPGWLKARLERERLAGLKAAGFDSEESAKAAADALKQKAEAEKTADQKAGEYKAKLDAEQAEKAKLEATVAEHAGRMLLGLTPEQQAAVKAIAGDDAGAQLRAIGALQPTWAKARDAEAAAKPAPAPAPATTSPAPTAPNGTTTSPPDHRAVYAEMRSKNPFAAAQYAQQHPEAYVSKG